MPSIAGIAGLGNVVDHDQVERAVQAGDELGSLAIAVDSPQDMLARDRDVVLDEVVISRLLCKSRHYKVPRSSRGSLKIGRRLDDHHGIEGPSGFSRECSVTSSEHRLLDDSWAAHPIVRLYPQAQTLSAGFGFGGCNPGATARADDPRRRAWAPACAAPWPTGRSPMAEPCRPTVHRPPSCWSIPADTGFRGVIVCVGTVWDRMCLPGAGRQMVPWNSSIPSSGLCWQPVASRNAADLLENNDVLAMNGNSFCDIDLSALDRAHRPYGAGVTRLLCCKAIAAGPAPSRSMIWAASLHLRAGHRRRRRA